MKKARKKSLREDAYGTRLIASLKEALAIERGEIRAPKVSTYLVTARTTSARPAPRYKPGQVRKIRSTVKLSQTVFAATLNVSPETVRAWEQGKKQPGGPAARLLELAELHPAWILGTVENRKLRPPSSRLGKDWLRHRPTVDADVIGAVLKERGSGR